MWAPRNLGRRRISTLIVLAMLGTLLALSGSTMAQASNTLETIDSFDNSPHSYNYGTATGTVACGGGGYFTVENGHVTLSGRIQEDGVTRFSQCSGDVIFPEGITVIEPEVFISNTYGMGISSLSFPSTLTSIGQGAFQDLQYLTSIDFGPNSQLQTIGASAFQNTPSLNSIDF